MPANHLKPLTDGQILHSQATLCISRVAQWGEARKVSLARLAEKLGIPLTL